MYRIELSNQSLAHFAIFSISELKVRAEETGFSTSIYRLVLSEKKKKKKKKKKR